MGNANGNFIPEFGDERNFCAKATKARAVWRGAHEEGSRRFSAPNFRKRILITKRKKFDATALRAQLGSLEKRENSAVIASPPHTLIEATYNYAAEGHVAQCR